MTHAMEPYGDDIFTEPNADPDGLANLGPLRPMAGTWESVRGVDAHPPARDPTPTVSPSKAASAMTTSNATSSSRSIRRPTGRS